MFLRIPAFILFFLPIFAMAQTGSVKGVITDITELPVPGSLVMLSPNLKTVSDDDGNYSFADVPYGTYTLQVSSADVVNRQRRGGGCTL